MKQMDKHKQKPREQRTEKNKKEKIMKIMKSTIATTVALAACVSTQLLAQNVKEGNITFALTGQEQVSVSETTAANAGDWVDPTTLRGPTHYKTGPTKMTQADLIKDISFTIYGTPNHYGSTAKLVLVQGELSGFFNMTPDLSNSVPDFNNGYVNSADGDESTSIANSTDSLFTLLATGRHFETNPITGQYPVGHLQPWGQIYVKWGSASVTTNCENVTYFFGISVQECYDCFYLNSFISDSTFTFKTVTHAQSGPPCCSVPSGEQLLGAGKDRYYMTLSFDDTVNNPYLDPVEGSLYYVGVTGISPTLSPVDGVLPDVSAYSQPITSRLGSPSPYEARFTLNGIMTYTWNLKFINSSDLYPDFVGTASYTANGYGFIQLYCTLLTGTVGITETLARASACCPEEIDTTSDSGSLDDWWYAVGDFNDTYDTDSTAALNSNLYFLWDGITPSTPFNTGANLSYHGNFNDGYVPFETYTSY
jgi:hypothetical protein